jgi:anthranilate synthase component 1/salicylate synthetase
MTIQRVEAPVEYHEYQTTFGGDSLDVLWRIASSGQFPEHVIYEGDGEYWFAAGSAGEVRVEDGRLVRRWRDQALSEPLEDDPFAQTSRALASLPLREWNAYGWIGFQLCHLTAGLCGPDGITGRVLDLVVPDLELRLAAGVATVRSLSPTLAASVRQLLATSGTRPAFEPRPVEVQAEGRARYERAVDAGLGWIRHHRLQKVILSRSVPVPFEVDMAATYALGRSRNTPARSFLVSLGGLEAAGFAPETVLEVDPAGRVAVQSLAGTRACGNDAETDRRLRLDLETDPKEAYEHALSIQAAVHDLGTICAPGSVRVEEFMSVKRRGTVQHLASVVRGELAPRRDAWDALRANFPAITVSGVPRRLAYECIAEIEGEPRGLYGGAVMRVGHTGAMDAALVLRTVFRQDGRAWLRAGAGIVPGSTPEREFQETCEKLRSVASFVVPREFTTGVPGASRR